MASEHQKIDPRPGLEVFENEAGTISIRQIDSGFYEDDPLVVVHPSDVPRLIEMLEIEQARIVAKG